MQPNISGANAVPKRKPLFLIWSAIAAAGIWLLFWQIEYNSRGCADGLCGFFPLVVGGGGLFLACVGFGIAGLARGERPRWLLLVPLLTMAALYARLSGTWPFDQDGTAVEYAEPHASPQAPGTDE